MKWMDHGHAVTSKCQIMPCGARKWLNKRRWSRNSCLIHWVATLATQLIDFLMLQLEYNSNRWRINTKSWNSSKGEEKKMHTRYLLQSINVVDDLQFQIDGELTQNFEVQAEDIRTMDEWGVVAYKISTSINQCCGWFTISDRWRINTKLWSSSRGKKNNGWMRYSCISDIYSINQCCGWLQFQDRWRINTKLCSSSKGKKNNGWMRYSCM